MLNKPNTHNYLNFINVNVQRNFLHFVLITLITALTCQSQVINKGGLYILPDTQMATVGAFNNGVDGKAFNNGTVYIYGDYSNDGLFDFRENFKTLGKVVFKSSQKQLIGGKKSSHFNDVEFDNSTEDVAFDVGIDLSFSGKVSFTNGVAKMNSDHQAFTFLQKAEAIGFKDASYLDGVVEKEGNVSFVFPIGNQGLIRSMSISKPKDLRDVFSAQYVYNDAEFFRGKSKLADDIELLGDTEYWNVEKNSRNKSNVILSFFWDERTTSNDLLDEADKSSLRIVRWDDNHKKWVIVGGVLDLANKEISTPAEVSDFGYFALAKIKEVFEGDSKVKVYNLVTPNGDGKNDYLIIENITLYPNNTVEIYNRWGNRVYETRNYASNGNVFTGISDGKSTIGKNKTLPSGTYYYIINYEMRDDMGARKIKKSGYLHLENY